MSQWTRIANVFRRERVKREIDEELQSHLEEAVAHGRDATEARRAFGSMLAVRERSREARVAARLDSIRADAVFGWRQLRKNKAATAAAIVSLGLAMGACLAAFRIIDALLLRPLPVAHPERLFTLTYPYPDPAGIVQTGDAFDWPQFRFLREAAGRDAELLGTSRPTRYSIRGGEGEEPERYYGQYVTGPVFASFGLKAAAGRLITPEDDRPGAHPVAVLSYDYWKRRFGRDPRVIGSVFGPGYEIIGVSEPGFAGTETGRVTDVFLPAATNREGMRNGEWSWLQIWVRPAEGVAPPLVEQKLGAALAGWRREKGRPAMELRLQRAAAGMSLVQRQYRRSVTVLGAVVALVLLIACANVANLMVAQGAARAREMALRVSIGAGRGRLVQLTLVESALVAAGASALGAAFAWWSAPFVVGRINSYENPVRLLLPADLRVAAFAAALAVAVAVLCGLAPAVRASGAHPLRAPRSRRGLMNALVAVQVCVCFVVLFAAGLFVATFERMAHQPTGFAAGGLIAVETATQGNRPQPPVYWEGIRQQLAAVSGVESAAIAGWALMSGPTWSGGVWVGRRRPEAEEWVYFLGVSPGWLGTMRIPLIDGRDFRPQDLFPGAAIVNEAFARRYFGGRSPVGKTFTTEQGRTEIVGFVRDARQVNMREPVLPAVYAPFPFPNNGRGVDWATFLVRTKSADPMGLASMLRREVSRVRPEFAAASVRAQAEIVAQHTVRERLLAGLSLFFACIAALLAAVGIYGVLSCSVVERRRDTAIRVALGARAGDVAWRTTGGMFGMLAAGAAAGSAIALAGERYVRELLYGVRGGDPAMLAGPAMIVLGAAVVAAVPAVGRALQSDPAEVLRAE